jgi:hypothetical protein
MAKAGGQGLLDMALTQEIDLLNLEESRTTINLNETLKAEITNILNAKQTIQFINEKFDYKTLNNFENQIRTKNIVRKITAI